MGDFFSEFAKFLDFCTSTRLEWTKNEQHSPGDTSGTERSGERKWSHRCGCPSPGPAEDSVGKVPRVPGLSGGQVLQPLPGRPWIYPNLYSGCYSCHGEQICGRRDSVRYLCTCRTRILGWCAFHFQRMVWNPGKPQDN